MIHAANKTASHAAQRTGRRGKRTAAGRSVSNRWLGNKRTPQLGLVARGQRGGWRAAAGRPKGSRTSTRIPHRPRARITKHQAAHITVKILPMRGSLRSPRAKRALEAIFMAEKRRKGFRLLHYSIQRNHIHLVCEGNHTVALSRGMQRLNSRIARRINKLWHRRGTFFADRYHGKLIKTPKQMRNVLRYVLLNMHQGSRKNNFGFPAVLVAAGCVASPQNIPNILRRRALPATTIPRRKTRSYSCANPKDAFIEAPGVRVPRGFDPYSSARWFDGWGGARGARCRGEPLPEGAPITEAVSWIARTGWRRHGAVADDVIVKAWVVRAMRRSHVRR